MTFTCPIGPPPVPQGDWTSRFWAWVTKVWFPFGRDADGLLDHGGLGGLEDDDHPQYLIDEPTTDRTNGIISVDDMVLLTLQRESLTPQTADVFRVINSALATLAKITADGKIHGTGLDSTGEEVTNVKDPTVAQSAATKAYVDALVPAGTNPGDILVWDGSGYDVLPIGADGTVLTADSGEPLGVKWA